MRDVTDRHGRIDVLVNNAGGSHVGAAEETTDAELRSLFDVHLFGPAPLIRAVLPGMRSHISASAQIADYTATVGPTRHMIETGNGTQPGDPAKAAAAIIFAHDPDPRRQRPQPPGRHNRG